MNTFPSALYITQTQIRRSCKYRQMNRASLKRKLLKPCKKILQLFKFRPCKPLSIRALRFHWKKPKHDATTTTHHGGRIRRILSVFKSLRRTREMDRVTELNSFSEAGHHVAPCSSPITPAYIRLSGKEVSDHEKEEDDSCRSFEKHLVEMIVEEGKTRDLVDVEELLYCWTNLKCPVFVDLVSRFYGELCVDLLNDREQTSNELLR